MRTKKNKKEASFVPVLKIEKSDEIDCAGVSRYLHSHAPFKLILVLFGSKALSDGECKILNFSSLARQEKKDFNMDICKKKKSNSAFTQVY